MGAGWNGQLDIHETQAVHLLAHQFSVLFRSGHVLLFERTAGTSKHQD